MGFHLDFTEEAKQGIARHEKSGNTAAQKKLHKLLIEHPRTGTGQPEQLKHYTEPTWARRISGKHRLVYEIHDEVVTVLVLSTYGHYDDK